MNIKLYYISIALSLFIISACQNIENKNTSSNEEIDFKIIISDIDNFWDAYDSLDIASDSVSVIQRLYIDKASPELLEFFKVRPMFTAEEYVKAIKDYPEFWKSVRSCTEKAGKNENLLIKAFLEIKNIYPEFKVPDICFAITPVMTGGTSSSDNKILFIGSEIVSADSTVIVSEFENVFKYVIGTFDILPYVIHESIHTSQIPDCEPSILSETISEGSADFITSYILKRNFNTLTYNYGYENECELWNKIKIDIENDTNYDNWFGAYDKNDHPDLGYFIGYRIVQSYFDNSEDKNQALVDIIRMKHPNEILKKSNYKGNCNN